MILLFLKAIHDQGGILDQLPLVGADSIGGGPEGADAEAEIQRYVYVYV